MVGPMHPMRRCVSRRWRAFGTSWSRQTQFVEADFAVTILVECGEGCGCAIDFRRGDLAILVCVENAHNRMPSSPAWPVRSGVSWTAGGWVIGGLGG